MKDEPCKKFILCRINNGGAVNCSKNAFCVDTMSQMRDNRLRNAKD